MWRNDKRQIRFYSLVRSTQFLMKQAGTEIWRQSGGGRWNEKTSLEVLHLKTTLKKIIHLCLVTFHTVWKCITFWDREFYRVLSTRDLLEFMVFYQVTIKWEVKRSWEVLESASWSETSWEKYWAKKSLIMTLRNHKTWC